MIKKSSKAVLLVLLILVAVFALQSIVIQKNYIDIDTNEEGGNLIGPIYQDIVYEQTFTATQNGLVAFDIKFATYARVNVADLSYSICDQSGSVISSGTVDTRMIDDNGYHRFSFPTISNSRGKLYSIKFSSNADENNIITAWGSAEDDYQGGELFVNGAKMPFDATFRLSYHQLNIGTFITLISFAAFMALFIYTEWEYVKAVIEYLGKMNRALKPSKPVFIIYNSRLLIYAAMLVLTVISVVKSSLLYLIIAAVLIIPASLIYKKIIKKKESEEGISRPASEFFRWVKEKFFSKSDNALIIESRSVSIANKFAITALIFGFIIILITPPLSAPDEGVHYANAMRIANGDFFLTVNDGVVGGYLTEGQHQLYSRFSVSGYLDYMTMKHFIMLEDSGQKVFMDYVQAEANPFAYNASALGAWLAMTVFGIENAYCVYIAARLANLALFIFVVRKAIKASPILNNTMSLIALMPMTMQQCCSLSYDATVICGSFLLFGYAMKLICAKSDYRITYSDMAAICFASFLLFCGKIAYFPLILVLLGISIKKFGSKRKYILSISLVAALAVAVYLIPTVLINDLTSVVTASEDIRITEQREFLMSNLDLIPSIFAKTFDVQGEFYLNSAVAHFGWLDTPVPQIYIYAFLGVLICVAAFELCLVKGVNLYTRTAAVFACAVAIIGTVLIMYIEWTPKETAVGGLVTIGVQGRYFVPLVLFAITALANSALVKYKHSERIHKGAVAISNITSILFLLVTIFIMYVRYWV